MTQREPLLGLRHMLDAAREAVEAAAGLKRPPTSRTTA